MWRSSLYNRHSSVWKFGWTGWVLHETPTVQRNETQIPNQWRCKQLEFNLFLYILQRNILWLGPPKQSCQIGLQENNNTFQESWLWAYQQLIRKQKVLEAHDLKIDSKCFVRKWNVSPGIVFIFETLHITPMRHICLKQAAILLPTRNSFATIAAFCNNKWPQVKTMTNVYIFHLNRHSNGPLRKLGLSLACSKGHICRLQLVDFDPCCQFCFVVLMIDK